MVGCFDVSERTKAFLSAKGMQLPRWPVNSPDLSPVENLWWILTRRVDGDKPAYDSFDLLKDAVKP